LAELASRQDRQWLAVNTSGWVDRRVFLAVLRAVCRVGIGVLWGLEPEKPAVLVLDAPTRADLVALRLLASNHIHVVTLPPHLE
jgi:hypothetical protein